VEAVAAMPVVPAPALPTKLYAEVAGLGVDGRGRDVAHLVLLRPRDGRTGDAVLGTGHRFLLVQARLVDWNGKIIGEVVESAAVPPGGLDWYGLRVPAGAWVGTVRVGDEKTRHALASARRVLLHPWSSGRRRSDVTTWTRRP
jgi:hypothetical protein